MKINPFTIYTSTTKTIKISSFTGMSALPPKDTFVKSSAVEDTQLISSIPRIKGNVQQYCHNNPKIEEEDAIQSILLAILEEKSVRKQADEKINDEEFEKIITSATKKTLTTLSEVPEVEIISVEEILGEVDNTSIDEQISKKTRVKKIRELLDKETLISDFRKAVLWKRFGFETGQKKSHEEIAQELNTTPETIRYSELMGIMDILISPTVIPIKIKELFPDKFM